MPHRSVPPRNRQFARKMRVDATKAENMLWQAIRGRKLEGLKFRRQVTIGAYIVDFVCLEKRLVLEVDGGQHSGSKRDEVRDSWLTEQGFQVLRFWNDEVEQNIDGVCLTILRTVGR